MRHCGGWSLCENILAVAILSISLAEWARIDRENRFVACIAAVKLMDHFGVPVLDGTMVAVELKLVCLALVVTLESESGVVAVFGIFV